MSGYPDWVLKYKEKGTAIHKIGKNYYLYKIKSKWDKDLKRAKKITEGYLGVITPEGLKKPRAFLTRPSRVREYGASRFLIKKNQKLLEGLEKGFPEWWKEIFLLSALRLIYQAPLKHMRVHYEDSWLSEQFPGARLKDKPLHNLLELVGADRESIVGFLRSFIGVKEALLVDLTSVFSSAKRMLLAAKGYNRKNDFTPQVNLLFLFSFEQKTPLFYRVLPGNVRDVKSLKVTIEESEIKEAIVIGDKGFYSRENVDLLEREGLNYILPLKRDSLLIDYTLLKKGKKQEFEGYFRFGKRYLWYYRCGEPNKRIVWVFLDERLRISEQEDYLNRIETHPEEGYSLKGFHRRVHSFGTIALITNLKDLPAEQIFQYFKSRHQIEAMFDAFKNMLHADKTYMRTDRAMEAWMFINYLALKYYYEIYQLLLEHKLLNKYSPADVLLYLTKVRKVKTGDKWIELEIPKQTRVIVEKLKLHIT